MGEYRFRDIEKDEGLWHQNHEDLSRRVVIKQKETKAQKRIVREMTKILDKRWQYFEQYKGLVQNDVCENFMRITDGVGYCGRLEIDMVHKEIYMLVIRRTGDSEEERRAANRKMNNLQTARDESGRKNDRENISQLSGGERSITTICLLLSLWQIVRSPIRCLDEYEVFMDSSHKTTATGLLSKTAKHDTATQYLFLTPTGICEKLKTLEAAYGKIFTIKSLKPPQRSIAT